jgi:hypothetical protein
MTTEHKDGSHDTRRKVMSARHSTKLAVIATICVIALTAGGAALARTPGQSDATASTAPLYGRVLSLGDLPGFWSVACPVAVTSAERWAMHSGSADELASNGFLNGLREPLRSANAAILGWSVVAQFRSAAGAQREARSDLDQARTLGGAYLQFTVPGIAGSHGYLTPNGSTTQITILFTEGRFQYLLEITGANTSDVVAMRGRLSKAAGTLFSRGSTR